MPFDATMPLRPGLLLAAACALGPAAAQQPAPERQLGEVTVRPASGALEEQRGAATQKTIIDRQEITALGGLTVGELVRKLPGIDAGEHGADGGMNARARGMSRDGVQFLVNGERPTANARFALTEVGCMPTQELERVEILRGGSAEFGSAAPVTVNRVLRLSVQNLLGAGTWRTATSHQGGPSWALTTRETGQRTWLLALEGQW